MIGLSPAGGRPWYAQAAKGLLAVLAVAVLQRGVFSHLPLWGVRPDIALVLVLLAGIHGGTGAGVRYGLALGAASDVFGGMLVGAHLIAYAAGGYIAGWISRRIFRDTILIPMVIVAGLTVVCHVVYQGIALGFGMAFPWSAGLWTFALPAALYHAVLVVPVHGLLVRMKRTPD